MISQAGMYIISIRVATASNLFSLKCISNPIQILAPSTSLISYDSTTQPDYILKFNGDFSSIVPAEIKANVYNYVLNNYGLSMAGMNCYSGSVYVTFYSSTSSSRPLIIALISGSLRISSNLTFVSVTANGVTYTCSNCSVTLTDTNTNSTSIIVSINLALISK